MDIQCCYASDFRDGEARAGWRNNRIVSRRITSNKDEK